MIKIYGLLVFSISLVSCHNPNYTNEKVNSANKFFEKNIIDTTSVIQRDVIINDTLFLYKKDFKNLTHNYYEHFFETKEDKLYNQLDPRNKYTESSFHNNPYWNGQIKKIDKHNLPTHWAELLYYNNKFYLKYPSDFCELSQKIVTDSSLISKNCEGPYQMNLNSVVKLNKNQYELSIGYKQPYLKKTIITIIDSLKGISLWKTNNSEIEYYADVNKFKKISIVKSDCNGNKCWRELRSQKFNHDKFIRDSK